MAGDRYAERAYYFPFKFSRVERARITFHRYRGMPWNFAVEALVNRGPAIQAYYEGTVLSAVFPGVEHRGHARQVSEWTSTNGRPARPGGGPAR